MQSTTDTINKNVLNFNFIIPQKQVVKIKWNYKSEKYLDKRLLDKYFFFIIENF